MENSTALICRPTIKIQSSEVTIDESGLLKNVDNGEQIPIPSTLTAVEVSDAVNNTITQITTGSIMSALSGGRNPGPNQGFDPFFSLILSSQGVNDMKDLSNIDLLMRGAQAVFQGVAGQIGKRYLLVSNSTAPSKKFEGTVEYNQHRLFVNLLSLRLMESALCVLVLISLVLVFITSRACTPQDPASLARIASLISESQHLTNTLSTTGSWSTKDLKILLEGTYATRYSTPVDGHHDGLPELVIDGNGMSDRHLINGKEKCWQPFSTRRWTRLTLPIFPLLIVIILEVLLRKSKHDNGFIYVASSRWTQIGASYIPALVMVLIKLLFSSFDLNLRIFDPFVQLKNGPARAKPSILNKSIYTWKADAFWTSLMTGRTAVGASAFAMVLASFLTIAVSSLYTAQEVSQSSAINLTRSDQFYNPVAMNTKPGYAPVYNTPINFSSSLAARLVVYEKMNSPVWTYGSSVLPNLTASHNVSQDLNISAVAVTIPVQQGSISCNLIPNDSITLNYSFWDNHVNNVKNNGADIYWKMPNVNLSACTNFGINSTTASTSLVAVADGYFAQYSGAQYLPPDSANCPTSYAIFGSWQDRRAIELNVMTCRSSIQESEAAALFSLPQWTIESLTVDESTTRNISTSMDTNLDLSAWVFGGTLPDGGIDNVFVGFTRNITSGALDTTLLRRSNFDKLYAQIQNKYSLAFAQILNLQGRNSSITPQPAITGIATSFSTYRLVQDRASTRVLQALLIGLIVCSITSLLTVRLTNVIPKNPCSIAAQASLISGSSILNNLPHGSQWMDDEEFNALFEGEKYSMGWKTDHDGKRVFRIDVADPALQAGKGKPDTMFSWWRRIRKVL